MATEKKEESANTKNDRVYVRLNRQLKRDFESLAHFRGLTPSAMLHSYVVQTVHEGRLANPELFGDAPPEKDTEPVEKKASSLSEKLVAAHAEKSSELKSFTTGDGNIIPLVEEWVGKE